MKENNELYYERMKRSVGDKIKLIDYILEKHSTSDIFNILDVGAGGGDLSVEIAKMFPNANIHQIENHPQALKRLKLNGCKNIHKVNLLENNFSNYIDEKFDVIICSAIIHEIYSYSSQRENSVKVFFINLEKLMKDNGVILIRDGVKPESGTITFSTDKENYNNLKKYVDKFNNESPFVINKTLEGIKPLGKSFVTDKQTMTEFLFTYTWGPDSWEREVREYYSWMDIHILESVITESMIIKDSRKYIQEGYKNHLEHIKILNNYFPYTNSIYMIKRRG